MLPIEHDDPVNARILAISEDKIEGFAREPFEEIARRSGVAVDVVMARIAAMLRAGTIRTYPEAPIRCRPARRLGRVVRQRPAKPFTAVRLR